MNHPSTISRTQDTPAPTAALSELGETALTYATIGWPVFPCQPRGKAPIGMCTPHGLKDATTDPALIRRWWTRFPTANIAVACGAPGPDVLDVDTKNDRDGMALYERALAAGLLREAAATIRTPSGGLHIWFDGTSQRGGAIGKAKALELKAVGGYVLLPPSYVMDTKYGYAGHYEVTDYRDRDGGGYVDFPAIRRLLEPPPTQRRRQLAGSSTNYDALIRHVERQPEGNRNKALFWAACRAVETGAPEAVMHRLVDAAITVGLDHAGAAGTVRSALRTARSRG